MELQPLTLEFMLDLLRDRATETRSQLVVKARIAVSPLGAQLLDFERERPLETIIY